MKENRKEGQGEIRERDERRINKGGPPRLLLQAKQSQFVNPRKKRNKFLYELKKINKISTIIKERKKKAENMSGKKSNKNRRIAKILIEKD